MLTEEIFAHELRMKRSSFLVISLLQRDAYMNLIRIFCGKVRQVKNEITSSQEE